MAVSSFFSTRFRCPIIFGSPFINRTPTAKSSKVRSWASVHAGAIRTATIARKLDTVNAARGGGNGNSPNSSHGGRATSAGGNPVHRGRPVRPGTEEGGHADMRGLFRRSFRLPAFNLPDSDRTDAHPQDRPGRQHRRKVIRGRCQGRCGASAEAFASVPQHHAPALGTH